MRLRVLVPVLGFVLAGTVLAHGAASADDRLSVCIDRASGTAARDQSVAEAVARSEGVDLTVEHFNSSDDDDGVTPREFSKLLNTKCQLVMGFPVDQNDASSMPGILRTTAYDHTGFVLVVAPGVTAKTLAGLAAGTKVAVTFETAPNLYFLSHPNIKPDVHNTDADTLKALTDGSVQAAIVWQPTVRAFLASTPSARLGVYPLNEPHARFDIVALYAPRSAEEAKRFDLALTHLTAPAGFDPAAVRKQNSSGFDPAMVRLAAVGTPPANAPPALYTKAQAVAGFAKYLGHCAMCHGAKLQGLSGPSLKGPNFASAKSNFAVGDIFMIVANNMPASAPGSLPQQDYVEVMAYLLQQNGYPAGTTALTFADATNSNVPLVYRGP
jgi:mono/diheme cytochrome c family protein